MKKLYVLCLIIFYTVVLSAQSNWVWQNLKPQGNDLRALSFCDRLNGWAVGTAGTVLHTSDGGTTWAPQYANSTNYFQDVVCLNPSTAIITGATGFIAKTTNGGASWDTMSLGSTFGISSVKFLDAKNGYAIEQYSSSNNKFFKTTDGGATWTTNSTGFGDIIYSIAFANSSIGYAAGGGLLGAGAIYKTTDGGTSWFKQTINTSYAIYSICAIDTVAWAVGYDGIILKTINNGEQWIKIIPGNTLTEDLNGVHFYKYKSYGKDAFLGMVVGLKGMAKRSFDMGYTWTTIMSDWVNYKTLYDVQMIDTLYGYAVGAKGKMMKTIDGGTTWFHQNSGLRAELWSAWFVDSLRGVTVGDSATNTGGYTDGKIYTTFDGGNNWKTTTFLNSTFEGVHFPSTAIGCAVGYNGAYAIAAKTLDGGNSWNLDVIDNFRGRLWSVAFSGAREGVAVGDSGMIMKTNDAGKTWSRISSGTTNALWYVLYTKSLYPRVPFDTPQAGYYAMGAGGKLLVSKDNGATWQVSPFSGTGGIYGMSIGAEKAIYLACSDGVYKSVTANVYTKTTSAGFTPSAVWAFSADMAYAVGNYGGVAVTTNGGTNWTAVKITGNTIRAICAGGINNAWIVGEAGTILKNAKAGITDIWTERISSSVPNGFRLEQNYPNPFNPTTRIEYGVPVTARVVLEIYDIKGALISTLINREQAPGNYSIELSKGAMTQMASGVYFYRLNAIELKSGNNFSSCKKMILLK